MISKKEHGARFFPLMKWNDEFLLGLRDMGGGFAGRRPKKRPRAMDQSRASMRMMKRTRRRLARFLPRHGRLMVR
ncbi:MAG: hypothetical protein OEZ04_04470 [Nitrospinota bacterium]|nr:hypothetical protein [Nitrospinota bacterium]